MRMFKSCMTASPLALSQKKAEGRKQYSKTARRLGCLLLSAFCLLVHPSAFILVLKARRVSLRRLARLPGGAAFERLDGARLVEVYDCVELLRELRVEVVAQPLCLRSVDDADGALEPRLPQKLASAAPVAQVQKEARESPLVEKRFLASL